MRRQEKADLRFKLFPVWQVYYVLFSWLQWMKKRSIDSEFRMVIAAIAMFFIRIYYGCVVQNWPKSRANQDHLSCRCEINLDTETETEWCNSVYYLWWGQRKNRERAKRTSKPILTTNCLIDSNGCSATMMFGLSVHCLFACTFRSLYSINCVVTHFVRVQSNLAAAETIQSNKKYLREQNVLESFIARLF